MLIRALFILEFVLIGVGVPLAGVAYTRGHFELANLGFLVLGAGAVLGGLETMLTRNIRMRRASSYPISFSGGAATGWGLTFVALGFVLGLFGAVESAGQEHIFIDLTIRRPGLALLPLGVFLLGTGVAQAVGPDQGRLSGMERVLALVDRVPGLILLLTSAVLLGAGGFELLQPARFDELVNALVGR